MENFQVARLQPPHWRTYPAAARIGALPDPLAAEAARLGARLMADDLAALGITVDCAPVLDLAFPGAHDIIGDRAFSLDPATVIELGRIVLDGHLDGGVLPVIKHIPGHGRAMADSHLALPKVTASAKQLSAHDFVTFRGLNHAPIAMTAHVVYQAIDPNRPATTSARVVHSVIRGEIGFRGLLISDDLSMAALQGPLGMRTKAAMLAGCDIALHCNGQLDEMKEVAREAKTLSRAALRRAEDALAQLRHPASLDIEKAEARFAEMTGAAA